MTTRQLRRNRGGFTLLELIVVLALLAITAAASVPAFLGESTATPEQRTATALAAVLTRTRDAARESSAPATVVLSPADGRYWITTRDSTATGVLALNGGVTMIGATDRILCRFEPTGPATPFTITIQGSRGVAVHVDAWSGEIGISDARKP